MKSILLTSLVLLSFHSYAQDKYVCTNGNAERIIEVIYQSADSQVPCEVKYTKPGSEEVLWRASNQTGYCEAKAKEFAAKQASFGWPCSLVTEEPEVAPEPAQNSTENESPDQ